MFNPVCTVLFIINILFHFTIPFSNANPSADDKMLIAFMRGHPKIQISDYSKEKCEAHLGIVHFMRMNWQSDKIPEEFEEFERTECQKYRKYLNILYEYLFREYTGIPTVKPKLVFQREIEIDGPIIYAVNCLAKISRYFHFNWRYGYEYKLNELFYSNDYFEPKLLNEERLNYEDKLENEAKLPINEMILQLAIDTAKEYPKNESLEGILRENFEEELEKMLKKVKERAYQINNNNMHYIIVGSKFDDKLNWTEDAFFTEFVKGLATNSEKFFKMAKEYSNYLSRKKEKRSVFWNDDEKRMISFELYEIEKMKKYLTQKYEAHLGIMFLMRENWQCDKEIGEEFEEKCQKYRKYLDILYEYFFRLYAEAKTPKVSKQLPPIGKPVFLKGIFFQKKLNEVVKKLNEISKTFWKKRENEKFSMLDIHLVNKEDLHYEMRKDSGKNSSIKNEIEIVNLRKEFEQKMEKMYENTKENAKEEKLKLEKAMENAASIYKKENLIKEYDDKFGTFISSPFS